MSLAGLALVSRCGAGALNTKNRTKNKNKKKTKKNGAGLVAGRAVGCIASTLCLLGLSSVLSACSLSVLACLGVVLVWLACCWFLVLFVCFLCACLLVRCACAACLPAGLCVLLCVLSVLCWPAVADAGRGPCPFGTGRVVGAS